MKQLKKDGSGKDKSENGHLTKRIMLNKTNLKTKKNNEKIRIIQNRTKRKDIKPEQGQFGKGTT